MDWGPLFNILLTLPLVLLLPPPSSESEMGREPDLCAAVAVAEEYSGKSKATLRANQRLQPASRQTRGVLRRI